jgi:alkylhydroperoxidase family enzyme
MTLEASNMTDEDVEALRRHYEEGEVVEICLVVGTFNSFNRINDALGVQPTGPGEGLDT